MSVWRRKGLPDDVQRLIGEICRLSVRHELPIWEVSARLKRSLIDRALKESNGSKRKAAKMVGITPRALYHYLKKW